MRHFAHHIGDYAAATAHLSFVEDAAYHRLLRRYYQDEKALPGDIAAVCRLVGARTKEEREAVRNVLGEFFTLEGDEWHQSRADKEIEAYRKKAGTARENGTGGGRPRNPQKTNPVSPSVRTEKLTNNHEPETKDLTTTPSVASSALRASQPGRSRLIPNDWEPPEAAIAQLRKGRPDLVGDFYDQRMTAFRMWCRSKAIMSHDFEATWFGFMQQSHAAPSARQAKPDPTVVTNHDSSEQWSARFRGYKPGGFWQEGTWGPRPESGRCRAPAPLVAEWQRQVQQ